VIWYQSSDAKDDVTMSIAVASDEYAQTDSVQKNTPRQVIPEDSPYPNPCGR